MKKVTIKDIAIMAGVSPTTVSLVLNDRPSRIAESTKTVIKDLAKKHNYMPNLNAKGLVMNKTNTIGLIIPDIENPFFASLAKTLETELRIHQYFLMLVNTNDVYENDIAAINNLNNRGVDGFLIILSNESFQYNKEIKKLLTNLNKPFVLLDRTFREFDANQISFDNKLGQYEATKHVIEKGYKKIGYIAPPENTFHSDLRLEGFKKALIKGNMKIDKDLIVYGNYRFDSGYLLTKGLIDKGVDAIVVSNDVMAYGAMKMINELELEVPKDIAIVGYDDLDFSSMQTISLTSVKQDKDLIGKKAVELLMSSMNNSANKGKVLLKPKLIIRNSVK